MPNPPYPSNSPPAQLQQRREEIQKEMKTLRAELQGECSSHTWERVCKLSSLSHDAGRLLGELQGRKKRNRGLDRRVKGQSIQLKSASRRLRVAQRLLQEIDELLTPLLLSLPADAQAAFKELLSQSLETYPPREQLLDHTRRRLKSHFGLQLNAAELNDFCAAALKQPVIGATPAGNDLRRLSYRGRVIYAVTHLASDGENAVATVYTTEMVNDMN